MRIYAMRARAADNIEHDARRSVRVRTYRSTYCARGLFENQGGVLKCEAPASLLLDKPRVRVAGAQVAWPGRQVKKTAAGECVGPHECCSSC
jgi:hypothetical protein